MPTVPTVAASGGSPSAPEGSQATAESLRVLLHYAIRAPSAYNTQPWLFELADGRVTLRLDRRRALPVIDPDFRELIMGCGAALFHLRLALRQYGFSPAVNRLPDAGDEDLLAVVEVPAGQFVPPTMEERALFATMARRHTCRLPFVNVALPEPLVETLAQAAGEDGAWLQVVRGSDARRAIARLVAKGDRTLWANPRYRDELAHWLRPNHGSYRDGMPGYAFGMSDLAAKLAPMAVRKLNLGRGRARLDFALVLGSPLLVVLGTDEDTRTDWLAAGEALAHVLLRAQVDGVCASFVSQPMQVPALRSRLAALTARREHDGSPQLLIRLGYGEEVRATPRRRVTEILRAPTPLPPSIGSAAAAELAEEAEVPGRSRRPEAPETDQAAW